MPSKLFPSSNHLSGARLFFKIFILLGLATNVWAAETNVKSAPKYLGMNSCSSSSCHGGATENRDQCLIWSKRDFHSRAYATLTTARSERMAEVLGIESATKDASCTICHAPFQTVPTQLQANRLDITKGISCESCHGPAENWIRSHTRPDFTHADRVNAGMRDLKNLYVRANTCVACHQNVPSKLLAAGHPELIFELDGQGVSQPKHWSESTSWSSAQTWLVGQAVALREMSWELSKNPNDQKLREKWSGLFWVLIKVEDDELPRSDESSTIDADRAGKVQRWSDEFARIASGMKWSVELTQKVLVSLASTSGDFSAKDSGQSIQARRAERLVLGLDRLVLALDSKQKLAVDSELNELFSLVQSLPDFDPTKFAQALEKFSDKLRDLR